MLQGRRFDLLIADVKMPGNSNSRIVRFAKQIAPGMPGTSPGCSANSN
jgi:hypothetical protein